jgi:hypothetical protein
MNTTGAFSGNILQLNALCVCAIIYYTLRKGTTMNKHCKDCKHHHNAGHPAGSNLAKTYNDWCIKFSRCASKAVGECKLKGGKTV